MHDFTSTKPGAVIFLCVKDIECVYLYKLTSIKSGVDIYLCVNDIEFAYLYDFASTKPGASCFCVLRISNMSICTI